MTPTEILIQLLDEHPDLFDFVLSLVLEAKSTTDLLQTEFQKLKP